MVKVVLGFIKFSAQLQIGVISLRGTIEIGVLTGSTEWYGRVSNLGLKTQGRHCGRNYMS